MKKLIFFIILDEDDFEPGIGNYRLQTKLTLCLFS